MTELPLNASIHLIAICGTGMGSLAGLLKSKGYKVRGSDQNIYPPMSLQLAKWGIPIQEGYRPENLEPRPDLVIVGNAMSRGNPEIEALIQSNIPYISFPQAIARFFLEDRESLVVAGTHGKSTTTAFLASMLENAGLSPGYLIGAVPKNFKNFELGNGKHFILEGDEYDTAFFDKKSKFLHYQPKRVLLTSIEFDHADIFKDYAAVEQAFCELLALIPQEGTLIACADSPSIQKILPQTSAKIWTYGFHPQANVRAEHYQFSRNGCTFELFVNHESKGLFQNRLIGKHNLQNTLGVIALCLDLGMSEEQIRLGLEKFMGIRRRQEILADALFLVLDDFAHHPTAISETLQAVRGAYPNRKIFAVFEPRSNTTVRKHFQEELADSLALADEVFIGPIHRAERIPLENRLNMDEVLHSIQKKGIDAWSGPVNSIEQKLYDSVRPNDLVLFMSNGSFDNLPDRMAQYALQQIK